MRQRLQNKILEHSHDAGAPFFELISPEERQGPPPGGDGRNGIVVHEVLQHIGRQEGRERRAEADIPDAEVQERQQDATAFCSSSRQHHGKRQVVHTALEGLRQRQCDLNGAVGVVALTDVQQARQACDGAEVHIVEAVFSAGER